MKQEINKIIVIKVGTSTLTKINDQGRYELDAKSFHRIGRQVVALQHDGYHVAIVSSAAITAGMFATGTMIRPSNNESSMPTLQALASIGWRHVLTMWANALDGLIVGELLITKNELEIESERSELLKVTHNLMINGHVAVINENDAITHEEIAFGDNDTLAATFASKLKQSKLFNSSVSLIVLSDIDGVYEDITNSETLISEIQDVQQVIHLAGNSVSAVGTGGMATKFAAASIATKNGVDMHIANGRNDAALRQSINRKTGTYFKNSEAVIFDGELHRVMSAPPLSS